MPRHATMKPQNLGAATRNFLKSLRPWLFPIIFAGLLAIAATICSIFGPSILGQMTDTAIGDYQAAIERAGGNVPGSAELNAALNWDKLGSLALTLIALYLVAAILNYLQGVILSIVAANYAKKSRAAIIAKISRLPISYFDQHQIGDTLSRMSSDVDAVSTTLANVLTQIITSITTLIGILIMMVIISPWLSVIALVAVPLSLIFVSLVAKKAQNYNRHGRSALSSLNSLIE